MVKMAFSVAKLATEEVHTLMQSVEHVTDLRLTYPVDSLNTGDRHPLT